MDDVDMYYMSRIYISYEQDTPCTQHRAERCEETRVFMTSHRILYSCLQ